MLATPRKTQCERRRGLTSKIRTVCSRVFSGERRELEHQAEGFDLRVSAHVERSRDASRGGGGREEEQIKMLTTPMSSVERESEERTARGNNAVMEDWVLGAIMVRAGVCSLVVCYVCPLAASQRFLCLISLSDSLSHLSFSSLLLALSPSRTLALSGLERQTVAALDASNGPDAGSSVNRGDRDLP
jgi:hypothetical protein